MPLLALLATTALAQDPIRPADQEVPLAMHLDVTRYALERSKTEGILQTFIPPSLPIDQFVDPSTLSQDGSVGSSLLGAEYHIGVENVVIVPQLKDFELIPTAGEVCRYDAHGNPALYKNDYYQVDVGVDVGINTGPGFDPYANPADRARLEVQATADLLGFIEWDIIDDTCEIWMDPEPITAHLKIRMGLPNDDDDGAWGFGIPDDGLVDPFVVAGREPSGCPYTPEGFETLAEQQGLDDVCLPLAVKIEDFGWEFDVSFDEIDLHCGWFLDLIKDIATDFFIDPDKLLADTIASSVNPQIEAALDDVQTQLEDALLGVFKPENGYGFELDPPIDLLGTQLGVRVCTRSIQMDERGLRLELSGKFTSGANTNPCVAAYDPGGSRVTVPPTPPRYSELGRYDVPGIDDFGIGDPKPANPAEIVFGLDDDFLNSAMYHVWRGGLLCQTLSADALPIELPAGLALDTSLINLLSAQAFADEFPVAKPLTIVTRPTEPPLVSTSTDGVDDAYLDLAGMEVDMYAELDSRLVRVAGLDVGVHAGVDVAFDGSTGLLGADIHLDPASIRPQVTFNDLEPDASEALENGLAGTIQQVVGPLLADALQTISFQLPAFGNIGVMSADLTAEGPIRDFLGVFGSVGLVSYGDPTVGGCDLFGGGGGGTGCDTGGCSGGGGTAGCSTAPAVRLGWLLLPLVVAVRRRRR